MKKGNYKFAYKELSEILAVTQAGPMAHEISLKLGEVCLNMGRSSQAISIFSQLMELKPIKAIQQETLMLTAKAYNNEQDYDKAARTLLGQWK